MNPTLTANACLLASCYHGQTKFSDQYLTTKKTSIFSVADTLCPSISPSVHPLVGLSIRIKSGAETRISARVCVESVMGGFTTLPARPQ